METHETQGLLSAALARPGGDLGPLLARLRPRLVFWCASRMSQALRQRIDPEDAAQEVLLAVHRDIRTYHGPDDRSFYKWLFVVAEHRLKDLAAYHGATKRHAIEPCTATQTSPSDAAVRVESIARLREAIGALSEEHRTVVALYRLESRDVKEVAEIMGRSENAVRVLYCRALKELRTILDRMTGPGGASLEDLTPWCGARPSGLASKSRRAHDRAPGSAGGGRARGEMLRDDLRLTE